MSIRERVPGSGGRGGWDWLEDVEVEDAVEMCCVLSEVLLSHANIIILTVVEGAVSKFNY